MPAVSKPKVPNIGAVAAWAAEAGCAGARFCAEKAGTAPAASAATAAPQRAIFLIMLTNPTPVTVPRVYPLSASRGRRFRRNDKMHGGVGAGYNKEGARPQPQLFPGESRGPDLTPYWPRLAQGNKQDRRSGRVDDLEPDHR